MEKSDLIAQLGPLRITAELANFGWRDFVVAASFGALIFAAIFILLLPLLHRKQDLKVTIREALAKINTMPEPQRLWRKAALISREFGDETVISSDQLYQHNRDVDHDQIDAKIIQLAAKAKS